MILSWINENTWNTSHNIKTGHYYPSSMSSCFCHICVFVCLRLCFFLFGFLTCPRTSFLRLGPFVFMLTVKMPIILFSFYCLYNSKIRKKWSQKHKERFISSNHRMLNVMKSCHSPLLCRSGFFSLFLFLISLGRWISGTIRGGC